MKSLLASLTLLGLIACHADDVTIVDPKDTADTADTVEIIINACVDSTGTYDAGDVWICSDDCNFCGCLEDGVIISTGMTCDIMPDTTGLDTGGSDTATG